MLISSVRTCFFSAGQCAAKPCPCLASRRHYQETASVGTEEAMRMKPERRHLYRTPCKTEVQHQNSYVNMQLAAFSGKRVGSKSQEIFFIGFVYIELSQPDDGCCINGFWRPPAVLALIDGKKNHQGKYCSWGIKKWNRTRHFHAIERHCRSHFPDVRMYVSSNVCSTSVNPDKHECTYICHW